MVAVALAVRKLFRFKFRQSTNAWNCLPPAHKARVINDSSVPTSTFSCLFPSHACVASCAFNVAACIIVTQINSSGAATYHVECWRLKVVRNGEVYLLKSAMCFGGRVGVCKAQMSLDVTGSVQSTKGR